MVLQHERYVACRATTADSSHKMCALSFVHWLNFLDAARSDILMPLTWSGHQTLYHAAAWSSCLVKLSKWHSISQRDTERIFTKAFVLLILLEQTNNWWDFDPTGRSQSSNTYFVLLPLSTSIYTLHISNTVCTELVMRKLVEAKWIRSSPCGNRTLCWFSSRNPARGHAAPWSASGHRSRTLLQYPRTRISVLVQKFNYETMNYYCVH